MMKSAYTMIDVAEAMAIVVSHAGRAAVRCEEVSVTPALLGRTLASDIIADCPFPPFRAAILDGFALDAGALPKSPPILLEVLDEAITAGTDPTVNVLGGSTCAYVTTGAKMPAGSTAVVGVEKTEEVVGNESGGGGGHLKGGPGAKKIKLTATPPLPGANVRPIGKDISAGTVVLRAGKVLDPADLGVLATLGRTKVLVAARVVVGVASTGSELVDFPVGAEAAVRDINAGSGRIRDVNRTVLLSLLQSLGAEVVDLGLVRDNWGALGDVLRKAIAPSAGDAAGCDVVVTTGGVSMGSADFVKPLLEQSALGGATTVHFGRLNMKPGKPTTFATVATASSLRSVLFFGLPGNPVSAYVTARLLVQPALKRMSGLPPAQCVHSQVNASAAADVKLDPERPEYHRVSIRWESPSLSIPPPQQQQQRKPLIGAGSAGGDGRFIATSTGGQISSRLLSVVGANALLCVPQGSGVLPAGTVLPALVLDGTIFPTPPRPREAFHRACAEMPSAEGGLHIGQSGNLLSTPASVPAVAASGAGELAMRLAALAIPCRLCVLTVAAPGDTGGVGAAPPRAGVADNSLVTAATAISSAAIGHLYASAAQNGLDLHLLESRVILATATVDTSEPPTLSPLSSDSASGGGVESASAAAVKQVVHSWTSGALGTVPDMVLVVGGCGIGTYGVVPEVLSGLTGRTDEANVDLGGALADRMLAAAALAAKDSESIFNLVAVQRTFVGVCRASTDPSIATSGNGVFTAAIPAPRAAALAALDVLIPLLGRLLQTRRTPQHPSSLTER